MIFTIEKGVPFPYTMSKKAEALRATLDIMEVGDRVKLTAPDSETAFVKACRAVRPSFWKWEHNGSAGDIIAYRALKEEK